MAHSPDIATYRRQEAFDWVPCPKAHSFGVSSKVAANRKVARRVQDPSGHDDDDKAPKRWASLGVHFVLFRAFCGLSRLFSPRCACLLLVF